MYRNDISPIDGKKIGDGVYITPLPVTGEGYSRTATIDTTKGKKSFKFMFQVAVDPKRTHVTSRKDYWVVRDFDAWDAARPYGILLKEI